MTELEILDPPRRSTQARPWRAATLHALRLLLLAAIVLLIRRQHLHWVATQEASSLTNITVDQARQFLPGADHLGAVEASHGGRQILDAAGDPIGYLIQTSPYSDGVVGYSGPTNMLIVFDSSDHVAGVSVLNSRDTADHVDRVNKDETFLNSFAGWTWNEDAGDGEIDGVSGATLTSLAITESIARRLGSERVSLRFPRPIMLDEVKPFFADAAALTPNAQMPQQMTVANQAGETLGAVFRTSPAADAIMGYQGPTDVLVAVDVDEQVIGLAIRASFDNEPYVEYVRDDAYFRKLFIGKSLPELAALDPVEARIEGVSGATMTSLAVADGLPMAASAASTVAPPQRDGVQASWRDLGTVAVLACACLIGFTRLRGHRWTRIGFQTVLVVYFGFLNGDLLSQALFVGWAQSGAAWRLAPGIVLLAAASLLAPALTKRQLYCHHICPYGAMQQWIKHRLPWRVSIRGKALRALALIPLALLSIVLITAMRHNGLNLASLEPFDAFLFWIAGAGSIAIAIVGLLAAAVSPMAYCRFGCPTGAILNYLRLNAGSDQLTRRDAAAVVLLLLAVALWLW